MALNYFIRSGQKELRCGYTTATCAALAAYGAAALLLSEKKADTLSLMTPKGIEVTVTPALLDKEGEGAVCGVVKDGGDDQDITHGLTVKAYVQKSDRPGIFIDGGEGIGRVTKPGLDQPVGSAAINRVPRAMIAQAVQDVCAVRNIKTAFRVIIAAEGGREIA